MDSTNKQVIMPEAIASITLSVITPDGFPALLTVRESDLDNLLDKMAVSGTSLVELGYKPQERGYGNYSQNTIETKQFSKPTGKTCPKCGKELVASTTKAGKEFFKCSGAKWNKFKKMNEGCEYVDWNNDADTTDTTKKEYGENEYSTDPKDESNYRAITSTQLEVLTNYLHERLHTIPAEKLKTMSFVEARDLINEIKAML